MGPTTFTDKKIRYFAAMFLVSAIALAAAGGVYYSFLKKNLFNKKKNDLSVIADLKVNQLASWHRERLNDAEMLSRDVLLREVLWSYRTSPTPQKETRLREWMAALQETYRYMNVFLLDPRGQLLLAGPGTSRYSERYHAPFARDAAAVGRVAVMDIHQDEGDEEGDRAIHIGLFIPIWRSGRVLGLVAIQVDPAIVVYPLLQSWPTVSPTGEILLVRPEGEEVVVLNELRRRKDAALALKFPLTDTGLPFVAAVRGQEGIFQGLDYNGRRVLAALRKVPSTPWFLVAKWDEEEVYADLFRQRYLLAVGVVLGIAFAGGGLMALWRRRQIRYYRLALELERERLVLVKHYDYLAKYTNDIMLLVERDSRRIMEVNDRAVAAYGYSREELLGLRLQDILAPDMRPLMPKRVENIFRENGSRFESRHRRKNGETFDVEVSARPIEIEGKGYFQAILRDIGERKAAEAALRESEEKYRELTEQIHDIVYSVDPAGTITYISPQVARYGYTPGDLMSHGFLEFIVPEDRETVLRDFKETMATGVEHPTMVRILGRDGQAHWIEERGRLRRDASENVTGIVGVIRDITESRRAEAALRESEERYRTLASIASEGIMIHRGGEICEANQVFAELAGFSSPQELIGKEGLRMVRFTPESEKKIRDHMRTGTTETYDLELVHPSGRLVPVETRGRDITFQGRPARLIYMRDITERKQAETALRESQRRFEQTTEESREMVWEVDAAGRTIAFEPAFPVEP
ncbi:MAG TPA: PAS domain S-box protein, partial [Elusimicrobiota bacterium]|nr:PAS domain S-box protein [Elusimicrobiota bacterium]